MNVCVNSRSYQLHQLTLTETKRLEKVIEEKNKNKPIEIAGTNIKIGDRVRAYVDGTDYGCGTVVSYHANTYPDDGKIRWDVMLDRGPYSQKPAIQCFYDGFLQVIK
jgi:hypothetical protein